MIRKLLKKLIGSASGPSVALGRRVDIPVSEHGINPALIDTQACDVVRTLKNAGFDAYIVGGAVRDLLVGLAPKDFDVATNATPEQVKQLFRRAFIIGRRFRIVHVVYGRGRAHEVIEVTTFRACVDQADTRQVRGNEKSSRRALEGMQHAVDASGRVLRDNVWGSQQEDAARRDFSINAMYYDPERQVVVDYHKGFADVRARRIRMIGDAALRYREDPVRIIRAVRFAAKLSHLGFTLDKATRAPLHDCLPLLADIPPSRLFDEMLKLLQTGHALASIGQLRALGLEEGIYPLLTLTVQRAEDPFVHAALTDTDRRVQAGLAVAPSFFLACLLWQDVRQSWQQHMQHNPRMPSQAALNQAIDEVFHARIGDISGRSKLGADMRTIWLMQPRFDKRTALQSCHSLIAQLRYRAGFDFLCLRAAVGEVDESLTDWWQTFSQADDALRHDLVAAARAEQHQHHSGRQSQKKPHKKSHPTAHTTAETAATAANAGSTTGKAQTATPATAGKPRTSLAPQQTEQTAAELVLRDLIYSRLEDYQARRAEGTTVQQLVDELQAEGHTSISVELFQSLYARARRKRTAKRRKAARAAQLAQPTQSAPNPAADTVSGSQ